MMKPVSIPAYVWLAVNFKKYNLVKYLYFLLLTVLLFSCAEKKEIFETESIADYVPLAIGKSITYRLDSTVFARSGTVIEVHKYQLKHTITGETTDNNGRKTFIIQRHLNNETASGSWAHNGTYFITPYDNKIEVLDNTMRVVTLQAPLKRDFTWKGNSQLPFAPYGPLFDMSTGYDMNTWSFVYSDFGNETLEGQTYNNVWTVEQHNETMNIPPTPETRIGTKEVSVEKYAKGIGLVYKDFHLYEYQGAGGSGNTSAHYTGFGITMWIVGHN
ncbi:MAG TPA: hypothetical protein PKE30_09410 [Niabella sp.]|nr:hypothetical protein [Niabella sp.]